MAFEVYRYTDKALLMLQVRFRGGMFGVEGVWRPAYGFLQCGKFAKLA